MGKDMKEYFLDHGKPIGEPFNAKIVRGERATELESRVVEKD